MTLNNKINKNSIIQISGKLLSLFFGLATVAIMTRYLGQEGFGYYITVVAFLQFFGILVDFGISLTTVQMISDLRRNVSDVLSNILTLRVIFSIIFLGLAPIIIWFFPYPMVVKLGVLITSFSFFCITIIQVLTGMFQRELKMLDVTIAEIVGRVLLLVMTIVIVFLGKSILWIFLAISIGSFVNLIITYLYSRKYFIFKWSFDFSVWKEVFQRTWPIALSISFNLIYLKMDTIILSLTRSQSEVGLYGATYRVIDILTNLPAVFMGIVLPHMTKYFIDNNKTELKNLMQNTFNSLMIFAVPIVVGTFLIAEKVMVFVAGSEFVDSGEILKVLILASGAIFFTSLFGYAVLAVHKQKVMMWGYLTTAVVTLAGYIYFIPKYGVWGAGWMTVFSEAVIAIWTFVVVYRETKFVPSFNVFIKGVFSSFVMLGVLYLIRDMHVLILLGVACVVYFGVMYLIGGIRKGFWKESWK
ncbi:hypothetical protein A2223_02270 [Candidatus Falkowbacteria bacterium RIFOXYA2_FULL_35_8]|uniref:Uncharacterized protein n=1 Tax=Candidatus Falkowbacteria bacterium RIFOXYC2_FULL_36_12 TaxID=1798002 RepID=A0A1F5T3A9_9BACT|nr:MAG: hypothetical protein A2478_02020 [Candidatus Falkowbacteria bacterium RIFOXYC2_FULL_36_12]OGF34814.1 MAG: hypothetical protein A2223_02270 [Candidatus Falkowbacteria bacterium RIFOXYA2_FULL_35_8]